MATRSRQAAIAANVPAASGGYSSESGVLAITGSAGVLIVNQYKSVAGSIS